MDQICFRYNCKRSLSEHPCHLAMDYELKIKRNDWLVADTCVRKQPIFALYFELENELKFYDLDAWFQMKIV